MKLYAYGEDGMTLWVVQKRLGEILRQVEDDSEPADCMVFYRPSFGRASGRGRHAFGEPDFIICSHKAVYIGEAKWHGSSDWTKKRSELSYRLNFHTTGRRQDTIRFYIRRWLRTRPANWHAFVGVQSEEFPHGHVPPEDGTRLADTLETVLSLIAEFYEPRRDIDIYDVALFEHDHAVPDAGWSVEPNTWKLVTVSCSEACIGRGPGHDQQQRGLVKLPAT